MNISHQGLSKSESFSGTQQGGDTQNREDSRRQTMNDPNGYGLIRHHDSSVAWAELLSVHSRIGRLLASETSR